MKIAPYPLHWPPGWPRTAYNDRRTLQDSYGSQRSWEGLTGRLLGELERLSAQNVILSTDQPIRRDGLPYAATRRIEDPGAAVYFERGEKQLVLAQDRYIDLRDNIRSLALAIEGLRQMERHGGNYVIERAFTGFEALPAPAAEGKWWATVLELNHEETLHLAMCERAYRELTKRFHPDKPGGSDVAMRRLINEAIAEARNHLQ